MYENAKNLRQILELPICDCPSDAKALTPTAGLEVWQA